MLVKLSRCLQRMQTMAIITGYLMREAFKHVMKYMNRILRSVIKTRGIKHCESEVLHRLHEHITENRKLVICLI